MLLVQDVERTEEGVCLNEGVSRDRMVSVHDPPGIPDLTFRPTQYVGGTRPGHD